MSSSLKRFVFPLLPNAVLKMLRSKHYVRKFQELSGSEEPEMEIIRTIVKAGDHVLDIGANFGTYTKFLSGLVGEEGRVYAFEPIPEVNGYLKNNLDVSAITNVDVFPLALSNRKGEAQFKIPRFEHSGENFYEAHLTSGEGDISVKTERLDNISFEDEIAFIKCDVEGAELLVLEGGEEILKNHRPVLMLEINDRLNSDSAIAIIQFLERFRYSLKYLGDKELSNSESRFQGVNYFFIPDSEA